MMLTILGLPPNTKYQDLKPLIRQQCNIVDFILDSMVSQPDGTKKVRIGLSDEREGNQLIKCLNGFRLMSGNIIKVEHVSKCSTLTSPQQSMGSQSGSNQPQSNYVNQHGYGNRSVDTNPSNTPWNTNPNQWEVNRSGPTQMPPQNYSYHQPEPYVSQGAQPQRASYGQEPHNQGYGYMNKNNASKPNSAQPQRSPYAQEPQNQGYGYMNKNNAPNSNIDKSRPVEGRSHVLRSVEIVDNPTKSRPGLVNKYPSNKDGFGARDKPITIMKDNFQGPSPYNMAPETSRYQAPTHGSTQPWAEPELQGYNDNRKFGDKRSIMKDHEGPGRMSAENFKQKHATEPERIVELERRRSPTSKHRISPFKGRNTREDARESPVRRMPPRGNVFPPGRGRSPPSERLSESVRRGSPSGRRVPSPDHRRMPPHYAPNQRGSPTRHMSPHKISPGRRPGSNRYSPDRHPADKPGDKYGAPDRRTNMKRVRPAYESAVVATKQEMYSGAYRPNVNENPQYPALAVHDRDQHRSPWQQDVVNSQPFKKSEGDRRDMARSFETLRGTDRRIVSNHDSKRGSPTRKSRSPHRRERVSPPRDRYKKHSPSPRSPRRSWAMEKRRSPEVNEPPPPPIWSEVSAHDEHYRGRPYLSKDVATEKEKRGPVWERSYEESRRDARRAENEAPRFETESRVRKDVVPKSDGHPVQESITSRHGFPSHDDRYVPLHQRGRSNYSPRHDFEEDDRDSHVPDMRQRQKNRVPIEQGSREYPPRDSFPKHIEERREDFHKISEEFHKDLDLIHKRAMEFTKKTDEFRRSQSNEGRRDNRALESQKHYDHGVPHKRDEEMYSRDHRDSTRFSYHRDGKDTQTRYKEPGHQEPEWKPNISTKYKREPSPSVKAKREKAVEELASQILDKQSVNLKGDTLKQVINELKFRLSRIIEDTWGDKDISFIEMVVKFNTNYNAADQDELFESAMSLFPDARRTFKRPAPASTEVPPKRRTPIDTGKDADISDPVTSQISDWNANAMLDSYGVPFETQQMPVVYDPTQFVVPLQTYVQSANELAHTNYSEIQSPSYDQLQREELSKIEFDNEFAGYSLYLCKDDFEPFTESQAEYLKRFLISEIIKVTETTNGWAPDFTLKGLQSLFRYELLTNDESSKDWLLNFDFNEFTLFNVLVYTKEELWYERAAIWLPGHSRCRNVEPLVKLKLQNKKLEGINVGKWKFVKKIVNVKGTRLYVDMPPSSARALESHKMMLSYELQKVNVFLKAVAVDKDSFDQGMKEQSIEDQSAIIAAAQNSPMPVIKDDNEVIKISLKGSKSLDVVQARKIKEMIIYHIFKYHQQNGNSKTDFVKYGLCQPGYFAVLPENKESKKWLKDLDIGKLGRQSVIILDSKKTSHYVRMFVNLPFTRDSNLALIQKRLKQSNKGVKGINFDQWKPWKINCHNKHTTYEVDVDLESAENIDKLKCQLDYVDLERSYVVHISFEHSRSKLQELIKRYQKESMDSYDVANMDIASSDDDSEVICLG